MRLGAQALLGRHDFASFQSTGGDVHTTERTITSISVGSDQGQTPFGSSVTGDGFLRHMVRISSGTLVDVGLGRGRRVMSPGFSTGAIARAGGTRRRRRPVWCGRLRSESRLAVAD